MIPNSKEKQSFLQTSGQDAGTQCLSRTRSVFRGHTVPLAPTADARRLYAPTAFPTIPFTMQDSPVSGAPAAQELSRGQKMYATDDGGGKRKNTRSAVYTANQDIDNQKYTK